MISEHEFIRNRLAIVEELLQNGPPEILVKQRQYDYMKNAVEANRYELEASLLRHILKATSDGRVLYALKQWSTTFRVMFDKHCLDNRELFYNYERWQTLSDYYGQNFAAKPPTPPALRYADQYGYEWTIDSKFLELLSHVRKGLETWLSTS